MPKSFYSVFIILLLSSCNRQYSNNNKEINNNSITNKTINVGIYVYDYPFGYISNGNIGGFDYDLMNEIARLSNLDINFYEMQFDELKSALESKNIDIVIAGMSVNDERKKEVNFSDKYYTSRQAVLIKKDNKTINTEDDLIGKNIGVIKNTVADNMFSKKDNVNVEKFDAGSSIILALKVGKVDAAVFDKVSCDHYVSYDNEIKIAENIIYPEEDYAIAFRKEDTALLNIVNNSLAQIMTNGFYEKIIAKHLGTNKK